MSALWAMDHMGVELGVLLEAKITDRIHTPYSSDYHVMAPEASSPHHGGIILFCKDPTH